MLAESRQIYLLSKLVRDGTFVSEMRLLIARGKKIFLFALLVLGRIKNSKLTGILKFGVVLQVSQMETDHHNQQRIEGWSTKEKSSWEVWKKI